MLPPPGDVPSQEYSWEWGGFPTRSPGPTSSAFQPFPDMSSLAPGHTTSSPLPSPSLLSESTATDQSPLPVHPPTVRVSSFPSAAHPTSSSSRTRTPNHSVAHGLHPRLKNHEDDPYRFTLEVVAPEGSSSSSGSGVSAPAAKRTHEFELSLCGEGDLGADTSVRYLYPPLPSAKDAR